MTKRLSSTDRGRRPADARSMTRPAVEWSERLLRAIASRDAVREPNDRALVRVRCGGVARIAPHADERRPGRRAVVAVLGPAPFLRRAGHRSLADRTAPVSQPG